MKKFICIALLVAFLLSFTGCKKSDTISEKEDLVTVYLVEVYSQNGDQTTYSYTDTGLRTSTNLNNRDTHSYEYKLDSDGKILEEVHAYQSTTFTTKYTYDAQDVLIEEKIYDANDELSQTVTYQYNDQGQLIYKNCTNGPSYIKEFLDPDSGTLVKEISSGQQYIYDNSGNAAEVRCFTNEKETDRYVYKRDTHGQVIETTAYKPDGSINEYLSSTAQYTYDNRNLPTTVTNHFPYRGTMDIVASYQYKEIRIDRTLAKNLLQVYGSSLVIISE